MRGNAETGVVGALIATGVRLLVVCQQCGFKTTGDLEKIAAAKGLDYDLTDRHPPCKVEGCGYWLGFYVREGMGMRRLETEAGSHRESEQRTRWLAERGPKRQKPPPG